MIYNPNQAIYYRYRGRSNFSVHYIVLKLNDELYFMFRSEWQRIWFKRTRRTQVERKKRATKTLYILFWCEWQTNGSKQLWFYSSCLNAYRLQSEDHYETVCQKCWLKVDIFHNFYLQIEYIHRPSVHREEYENIFVQTLKELPGESVPLPDGTDIAIIEPLAVKAERLEEPACAHQTQEIHAIEFVESKVGLRDVVRKAGPKSKVATVQTKGTSSSNQWVSKFMCMIVNRTTHFSDRLQVRQMRWAFSHSVQIKEPHQRRPREIGIQMHQNRMQWKFYDETDAIASRKRQAYNS